MEFQPPSENGKHLTAVLENWLKKSPEWAVDKLKRMFIANSLKVKNEDAFVGALYGQILLRVQHAIEMSLNERCGKELVAALELSENQNFVIQVLSWTEKCTKEFQVIL